MRDRSRTTSETHRTIAIDTGEVVRVAVCSVCEHCRQSSRSVRRGAQPDLVGWGFVQFPTSLAQADRNSMDRNRSCSCCYARRSQIDSRRFRVNVITPRTESAMTMPKIRASAVTCIVSVSAPTIAPITAVAAANSGPGCKLLLCRLRSRSDRSTTMAMPATHPAITATNCFHELQSIVRTSKIGTPIRMAITLAYATSRWLLGEGVKALPNPALR